MFKLIKFIALFAIVSGLSIAPSTSRAQGNVICGTAPTGDSSNRCASTEFVQDALAGYAAQLIVGSSPILSGTDYGVLFNNAGVLGNTAAGASGYILTGNGSAAPSFQGFQSLGASSGVVTFSQFNRAQPLHLYPDYCSDNTGSTDCATAITNAFNDACTLKKALYIPAGTYRSATSQSWNMTNCASYGVTVFGDGKQMSRITFDAGAAFEIVATGAVPLFYGRFDEFGIQGAVSGVFAKFGDAAFAEGGLNEFWINLWIGNVSTNAAAVAAQFNFLVNAAKFFCVCNGAGDTFGTAAATFNQVQMSKIEGSFGNSLVGIKLQTGYNLGNVFANLDVEEVGTGIVINNPETQNNTFLGGTCNADTGCINATAGSNNTVNNLLPTGVTVPVLSGSGINYQQGFKFGTANVTGFLQLAGASSGLITLVPAVNAGTYNWNWPVTAGSAGECLKSGGGGSTPMSFGSCASAITPAALTKVDDANVTLTLGGTPGAALLQSVSISAGWSGFLGPARGGFGIDVSAQSGVPLFAAGTPTFTSTTGTGNVARASSPTITTPAITNAATLTTAPAANTSNDGLILQDVTAATSGNQQYSPRLRLSGQGWKTDATAASQPVDWIVENVPVQGTANPSGSLIFSSQINGGGYTGRIYATSAGNLGIGGSPGVDLNVFGKGSSAAVQRMHANGQDADYSFDGTSINYTNYVSGGVINFTQVGAGSQNFSVNGANVLVLTSANAAVTGNMQVSGAIACGAPVTKTGTSGTVGANECSTIFNPSGTYTVTLPSASTNTGRWLYVKSIAAQAVNSASSNVVPRTTAVAGTALLASGAGNWASLQSDGTNWVVMAGN